MDGLVVLAQDPDCKPCNDRLECVGISLDGDRVVMTTYELDPATRARLKLAPGEDAGWLPREKARAMFREALRRLEEL